MAARRATPFFFFFCLPDTASETDAAPGLRRSSTHRFLRIVVFCRTTPQERTEWNLLQQNRKQKTRLACLSFPSHQLGVCGAPSCSEHHATETGCCRFSQAATLFRDLSLSVPNMGLAWPWSNRGSNLDASTLSGSRLATSALVEPLPSQLRWTRAPKLGWHWLGLARRQPPLSAARRRGVTSHGLLDLVIGPCHSFFLLLLQPSRSLSSITAVACFVLGLLGPVLSFILYSCLVSRFRFAHTVAPMKW